MKKINTRTKTRTKTSKSLIIILVFFLSVMLVSCKNKKELLSLEIVPPTKITYYVGESFEKSGLVVTAVYKDGTKEIINDYEITGFDSVTAGEKIITVKYQEVLETFKINIINDNRKEVTTTRLITYDVPSPMETSKDYVVKVNDQPLFVYETRVNHRRVFSWGVPNTTVPVVNFDFEGKVKVEIDVVGKEIENPQVSPLSYGIEPKIEKGKIVFELLYPDNYTVEYSVKNESLGNNEGERAVHIFANQIDENPITKEMAANDDSIIYIGPGVHKTDTIPLKNGVTVYIAGGAVLFGQFDGYGLTDVTIRGRGIIDGSIYSRTSASERAIPFVFKQSKNIRIEGVTVLDPAGWAVHIQQSEDVNIDNVKIITARPNGDGISIQSSRNVLVENSFVRSWDDSLVVKNVEGDSTEKIRFNNIIVWTDLAQSMEVGYEANGEYMTDIVFENITVLHNYHKSVMSIHNADQADISNVIFRNITIEDAQMIGDNPVSTDDDFFIDLDIRFNAEWSTSKEKRGTIDNILFDNIIVLKAKDILHTRLSGFSQNKAVTNVRFNNIMMVDQEIHNAEDLNVGSNNYVDGVQYVFTSKPTGAQINIPYILNLTDDKVNHLGVSVANQLGIEIPEFAIKKIVAPYAGIEITGGFTARATLGSSRNDWGNSQVEEYSREGYNVSNVLVKTNDLWISKEFKYVNQEYIALTINLEGKQQVGTIRIFGDINSNLYQKQNIAIFGQTAQGGNFLSKMTAVDYEFSNSSGNYNDIKLIPEELNAIQIRFYGKKGIEYAKYAFASSIEFYPSSLTYGKSVYYSDHEDVYQGTNLVDGNLLTYFESKKGIFPAFFVVDIGTIEIVRFINLHLPPLTSWSARTQKIEVQISTNAYGNNTVYTTLFEAKDYLFDSATGNMVSIAIPEGVSIRTIKLIFTANSSPSGEAAQLSEINLY